MSNNEWKLRDKIQELENENEYLRLLWNTAYDLGVRVEHDPVTGEIIRSWVQNKSK